MELKNFFAQDDQGNLLGGATCYLYVRGTENLATGLQAANGTALANPFTADATGLIQFAAPNGLYDLRVVKGARDYRVRVQCLDVEESVAEAEAAANRAEGARDAAQAGGNIYPDEAAGLAAVAVGQYFKVAGAGSIAASEFRKRPAPNLFDSATVRNGYYLSSSDGTIQPAAGWGCSEFIPVAPGQSYTISGNRGRAGLAFFSAASGAAVVPGSYNGASTLPLTVVAPAGAAYMAINLYSSTNGSYSSVQVEPGTSATSYLAYGEAFAEPTTTYPSGAAVSALEARSASLESQATSLDSRASALEARASSIEASTSELPINYVQNVLANGDMAVTPPAWTYTGTSPIASVGDVAELADLGIDNAYSWPTTGGVASQVRVKSTLLSAMNIAAGDHIMLGCFVYASDGLAFPSNFGSFAITMNEAVTNGMDSTGYVQVSEHVRFMWGKKLVPAGTPTEIVIGFTSAAIAASPAVRYHSGVFLAKEAESIDTPTADTISRYAGWDGQASAGQLFATLSRVAEDYDAGLLGDSDYAPRLVLSGTGNSESYIEVRRQGKTIRRTFRPFPALSKIASGVFDFRNDMVDGVSIKSMSDDAAPYRALGTTIGANHGYYMFSAPAAGHAKTLADIGSVYANGGIEWVIISIIDANSLHIARRSSNESTPAPAGTYTHVSGGANTGSITVTAPGAVVQLYPPFINRAIRCLVDGVQITETTASLTFAREVAFVESYDIIERADLIAWYEANGASGAIQPTGTPAISVSISYVFDHEGGCTIYTDFLARKSGIALQDIMFLQAQRMTTVIDGPVEYYIPKALPVTHHGVVYDYANIDSSDTTAWTTRLDFTPARCEPTGILCDRVVQLTNSHGFAMGFLPLQSTSLETRRSNVTVKALQLSNSSGKVYLSAIDKGGITLNAGDYFSTIGYRHVLVREAGRTCCYPVRTNGADYLYVDWHAAGVDRVPVPADYAGRTFEVIEKSANVTLLSQALTNSLVVDVADTSSYGYLILKVL